MKNDSERGRESEKRREFLETGARFYLQGMAAMAKFQRQVHEVCQRVLTKRLTELGKAVGQPLDASQIKVSAYPAKAEDQITSDGTSASFGVKLLQKGLGTFYLYVWWRYADSETPLVSAVASVYCHRGDVRTKLLSSFKRASGGRIQDEEGEHWMEEIIAPTDFPDLEQKLDAPMSDWIRIWTQIGGLKRHL